MIIWNGKDNFGNNVQPGGYVLIVESTNSITGEISYQKLLIVVGN